MAKSVKGKTENQSEPKTPKETPKKASPKSKKQMEDDEDDEDIDEEETSTATKAAKPTSKKKGEEDDDDDAAVGEDEVDEWDKPEEEETWDPDFEEFDLPKSKVKKPAGGGTGAKKGKEEEELGVDEEFKDMDLFNDSGFDEEDDDY
ncbi:MAG: hypothetical protein H7Y31_04575 [Chitinophagaceae bacterium]|nr:hypothetical protein [Chitinophagaceae bacterium]